MLDEATERNGKDRNMDKDTPPKREPDWFLVSTGGHDCIWACHKCEPTCVLTAVKRPHKCPEPK